MLIIWLEINKLGTWAKLLNLHSYDFCELDENLKSKWVDIIIKNWFITMIILNSGLEHIRMQHLLDQNHFENFLQDHVHKYPWSSSWQSLSRKALIDDSWGDRIEFILIKTE